MSLTLSRIPAVHLLRRVESTSQTSKTNQTSLTMPALIADFNFIVANRKRAIKRQLSWQEYLSSSCIIQIYLQLKSTVKPKWLILVTLQLRAVKECHCERSEAISDCHVIFIPRNDRDCHGLAARNDKSSPCVTEALPILNSAMKNLKKPRTW